MNRYNINLLLATVMNWTMSRFWFTELTCCIRFCSKLKINKLSSSIKLIYFDIIRRIF